VRKRAVGKEHCVCRLLLQRLAVEVDRAHIVLLCVADAFVVGRVCVMGARGNGGVRCRRALVVCAQQHGMF
jgi:hypothetical protein